MKFTTADLCDAFAPGLQQAQPLFHDYGGASRFGGPIETLKVFEDNALVRRALEAKGEGRVLVVDGGGSLRSALVGGRLAALARDNGWAGLIVNGCVRDSVETRRVGVGIKALNTSPMRSGKSGAGEPSV
ncbi:MAG TPA: ribonuclease E activity regulator RraA, partial [Gemmatimonadales bacterium]|nr:ribonuclease E activity regulator RraA [Gemmatimonadales bacterium]